MKIFIIGGGVIGVSTAYFLKKQGLNNITILDRQKEVAKECSYANGSQLSYTNAEPWATPENFQKALSWIFQKNAPFKINFLRPDFKMYAWVLRFILQCRDIKRYQNTYNILNLNLYSKKLLEENTIDFNFDFSFQKDAGILHIFHSKKELEDAKDISIFQAENNAPFKLLTKEECFIRETSLRNSKVEIFGGMVYEKDDLGDMFAFTKNLANKLKNQGVRFVLNNEVKEIHKFNNKIISLKTTSQTFTPDVVIVAGGAVSPVLTRKIGVRIPVYPMKGYSLTLDIKNQENAPLYSIMDQKEKVVFTKIGSKLRVAGTAELNGYNYKITKSRIEYLKTLTSKYFEGCGDIKAAEGWACLRPSTPDGMPIIGRTKIKNLYLATGNGTLGWTQALATAKITADIVANKKPEIDIKPMLISRFGWF